MDDNHFREQLVKIEQLQRSARRFFLIANRQRLRVARLLGGRVRRLGSASVEACTPLPGRAGEGGWFGSGLRPRGSARFHHRFQVRGGNVLSAAAPIVRWSSSEPQVELDAVRTGSAVGSGRRESRAGRSAEDDLVRRALEDLRANQAARRPAYNTAVVETDEVAALSRLAHDVFGDRGVIEFDCHPLTNKRTGALLLGYFLTPTPPPGTPKDPKRPRILLFKGASHRELADQVARWRAMGGDS
jgi:hypothetical protein